MTEISPPHSPSTTAAEPLPARRRLAPPARAGRRLGFGIVLPLLVLTLILIGRLLSADFLTPPNLVNVARAVALLGIVSVGVAFVTYSGHYVDLSIPSIMALSGIAAVAALPLGFAAAILIGLAAGALVGLLNGIVIGYLRVNPIIWTLAMLSLIDGTIRWGFGGRQVYPDATSPAGQRMLGLFTADLPGHLPLILALFACIAVVGWFITTCTTYGIQLKLVGSSYEAARMTGINVRAAIAIAFTLSALMAAAAGILLTSLNKVGAAYIGAGYDFAAVTAVVIGGVTLTGGRGGIPGVVAGVLTIGLLRNILTLFGVGTFGQQIVQGAIFIAVVGAQSYAARKGGRDHD